MMPSLDRVRGHGERAHRRNVRYWPTPRQRDLLRAVFLPPEAGLEAWRSGRSALLADPADPGAEWLRPLLFGAVPGLDPEDALIPELGRAHAESAERHARYRIHLVPLLGQLRNAAIPVLLLKGAALAPRYYREPAHRPMSDIDLAVPSEEVRRALALLQAEGWVPREPVTPRLQRLEHAAHFADADGCQLDLHWRIFHEAGPLDADDELWDAARPTAVDGAMALELCATDALLHVSVHGARWTKTSGIRWAADGFSILRDETIDWDRFVRQARRREVVTRARWTVAYLRTALGAPVPDEALAELAATPVSMLERLEHAVVARPRGPLGGLPTLWCRYLRTQRHRSALSLLRFPRFLGDVWGLDSAAELPAAVATRVARRLPGRSGATRQPAA